MHTEYHTIADDLKLKTNNHTVKYQTNNYGHILIFFEFNNQIYCLLEKLYEIERKNKIQKLQKENVSNVLHSNFYEIFKFMRINSNESMEYEIIKLEEINNLCVTAKLIIDKKQRKTGNDTVESCIYLTDCVDFDNFD